MYQRNFHNRKIKNYIGPNNLFLREVTLFINFIQLLHLEGDKASALLVQERVDVVGEGAGGVSVGLISSWEQGEVDIVETLLCQHTRGTLCLESSVHHLDLLLAEPGLIHQTLNTGGPMTMRSTELLELLHGVDVNISDVIILIIIITTPAEQFLQTLHPVIQSCLEEAPLSLHHLQSSLADVQMNLATL